MHPEASPDLVFPFVALVVGVIAAVLKLIHRAAVAGKRDPKRDVGRAALAIFAWMALGSALAFAGVLRDFSLPPALPIFAFTGFGLSIALALSKFGKHLATHVPLWALVGINAFRLPLEVLMNQAQSAGVMPVQMSYSGQNYDVLTGVLAIIVGIICYRTPSFRLARLFNIIGFALLLNILTIAILSMPLPFRVYMNEPANTWIAYFPFVWLPAVLVPTALISHILILRRVAMEMNQLRTK